MTSDFLKQYDASEDVLKKLYDSRLRLSILDALKEGPLRLADLKRAVGSSAPNTSAKAKDLEDLGLVEREAGDYKLTPYGEVSLEWIAEAAGFHSTYEKFKEFWSTRRMETLPKEFLKRLGDLNDSVLLKTTNKNVTLVHDEFIRFLHSMGGRFYGVSPIYHDEYLRVLLEKLQQGVETKLVLTSDIVRELLINLKKTGLTPQLLELLKRGEYYEYEGQIGLAMTVTADDTFLGLQMKDGNWVADMGIYSKNPKALEWGLDIFEYYRSKSKKLNLGDFA